MRSVLSIFLIVCLTAGKQSVADEEFIRPQIQQWVQQLGDESFLVRERAQSLLIHAGIQAYHELRRAKQSNDLEIVRRAEYVLSQIEQSLFDTANEDVAVWIQFYMMEHNPASKARIIWALADPSLDLKRGEGLYTLCQLVRFEQNATLRLEAAKTLIAHPPVSRMLRQKWFEHIRDNFSETDDDPLSQTLAHYATLWCDLDDANEKTTPEFQERTRQVSAETLRLLERPENTIQTGSAVDILLHYAVAELQDAAGLIEERDETVAAALAIQSEPIRSVEPVLPVGFVDNDLLMFEHYHAGLCLRLRLRLHWALPHFQQVMESGDVFLRVLASESAAQIALYFADYALAVDFYDKHLEILDSPEYRAEHNPTRQINQAQKRKGYALARIAAEEENWEKVQELIMQAWSMPDTSIEIADIDLVILAHRLYEQQNDLPREFLDRMEQSLTQLWRYIMGVHDRSLPDSPQETIPFVGNTGAWLLANTNGNYQSALILVKAALQLEPDSVHFLDTLAHVYFLGGNIDEAIRTQEQVVRLAPEVVIFQQVLERFRQEKER